MLNLSLSSYSSCPLFLLRAKFLASSETICMTDSPQAFAVASPWGSSCPCFFLCRLSSLLPSPKACSYLCPSSSVTPLISVWSGTTTSFMLSIIIISIIAIHHKKYSWYPHHTVGACGAQCLIKPLSLFLIILLLSCHSILPLCIHLFSAEGPVTSGWWIFWILTLSSKLFTILQGLCNRKKLWSIPLYLRLKSLVTFDHEKTKLKAYSFH